MSAPGAEKDGGGRSGSRRRRRSSLSAVARRVAPVKRDRAARQTLASGRAGAQRDRGGLGGGGRPSRHRHSRLALLADLDGHGGQGGNSRGRGREWFPPALGSNLRPEGERLDRPTGPDGLTAGLARPLSFLSGPRPLHCTDALRHCLFLLSRLRSQDEKCLTPRQLQKDPSSSLDAWPGLLLRGSTFLLARDYPSLPPYFAIVGSIDPNKSRISRPAHLRSIRTVNRDALSGVCTLAARSRCPKMSDVGLLASLFFLLASRWKSQALPRSAANADPTRAAVGQDARCARCCPPTLPQP